MFDQTKKNHKLMPLLLGTFGLVALFAFQNCSGPNTSLTTSSEESTVQVKPSQMIRFVEKQQPAKNYTAQTETPISIVLE